MRYLAVLGALGCLPAAVAGCYSTTTDDAGDVADGRGDADDGDGGPGVTCGDVTCPSGQACTHPCCGGADTGVACDAGPPSCVPVPPACGASPTCSCFPSDPCAVRGTCTNITDLQVTCMCA